MYAHTHIDMTAKSSRRRIGRLPDSVASNEVPAELLPCTIYCALTNNLQATEIRLGERGRASFRCRGIVSNNIIQCWAVISFVAYGQN